MSNKMPTASDGSDESCSGSIMSLCVGIFSLSLLFMLVVQTSFTLIAVCLVAVLIWFLCLLFRLLGIFNGGTKDKRRFEELMEDYQEQDWMKDR
ncbi:MAG: hypothetical protein OXF50_24500 [Caldilineaceae bacterium]|nr:hypothetical protein [Caldilineaceae bacterium]